MHDRRRSGPGRACSAPTMRYRNTRLGTAHRSNTPDTKIVSWNLLRLTGAVLDDVVRLVEAERPDLLLMQEVTHDFDGLCSRIGGYYARTPLPGRIHGLAMWSPRPMPQAPVSCRCHRAR